MQIYKVDYLSDLPERHLERSIEGEVSNFSIEFKYSILMLKDCVVAAPPGFSLVAAVQVGVAKQDGSWIYGGDMTHSLEVKTGEFVLDNNHLQLWLQDEDKKPRFHVGDLFFTDMIALGKHYHSGNNKDDIVRRLGKLLGQKITGKLDYLIAENHKRSMTILDELRQIGEEDQILQHQVRLVL